ncbi:PDR/VanB family oxidoreductase [Streptomyces sp. NPDC094437]|uniref:PDR/VanB family oxidoreductase n=1 Tax=Streptomyces sp. NPDC094437 TaxID=3366060 RepID=UPI003816FF96
MTTQTLDTVVHAISLASSSGASRCYELRAADGGTLPPFEAGAHVDVHLGPSLVRSYSLLNSPQQKDRYLICVRRDDTGRGGSQAMHRDIAVGQRLRISAPRNLFALVDAERYILLGGGIGVTPLLSMAETLAARGAAFTLHHYTTGEADAPLLERLREAPFADRVTVHHSAAGDSVRAGLPAELHAPDAESAVYVCGPAGFMAHVTERAGELGWRDGQIRLERFAPAARTDEQPADDGEFSVRIASTGACYAVPPDRTIAEVLTDHGVEIELSCEQGMCGACLTPVLAGEPDHRDDVQTSEEHAANTQITLCCSRARTPELVLGL